MSGDELFFELGDEPRLGGKGRSLARLRRAGLRVPEGFVVGDALFAGLVGPALRAGGPAPAVRAAIERGAWPDGFSEELGRRLRALGGGRFSVRSSFAAEDDPESVAAGIFRSCTDVAAAEVEAALREVLLSAVAPAAAAHAAARGRALAEPPVSVLVHRYQTGDRSGGAAWDPAAPEQPPVVDGREGPPTERVRAALEAALRALAARHGAVEIEWVADGEEVTFLQLRPYRAPVSPRPWAGSRELPPGPAWRWDAAHNPLPLTPAQAGLVALVDAAGGTGFHQQVAGGYLFWAEGASPPPRSIPPAAIATELARIEQSATAALAALGAPPALEPALQTFAAFYQPIYGVLRPALRQARSALLTFLNENAPSPSDPIVPTPVSHAPSPSPPIVPVPAPVPVPVPEPVSRPRPSNTNAPASLIPLLLAGVPSRAAQRRQLADGIARATTPVQRQGAVDVYLQCFGDESAVWDVAAPTHREQPQVLADRLSRAVPSGAVASDWRSAADRVRAHLPGTLVAAWEATLDHARAAAAAAEDDDWIYARLQAPVRRALLDLGDRLTAAGALDHRDDVFYLPLDTARALAAGQPPGPTARTVAAAGRAAFEAALRDPPPLPAAFGARSGSGPVLRGHGTGGRALGRVHRHDPAGPPPPPDAVLVATTLLPTELPLLQVAALVTETGGPLDHVATQARERGLPAVTGVARALSELHPGDLVLVDADAGLVIPTNTSEP